MGDVELRKVDEVRDLGFIVDGKLCFESHCKYISNKAESRLFQLLRSLYTKDPCLLIRAYKAFIRPMLEYGTVIFYPHNKKAISRLETIQNSFTRKILIRALGFNYNAIPRGIVRNKMLGLESLQCRRKKFDLVTAFKIITGKLSLDTRTFFTLLPSTTRGGRLKPSLPKARSSIRNKFFTLRAFSEFSRFCKKYPLANTTAQLKRNLNKYYA